MTTAGTYYYQPSAGTGNLLLANPPFIFQSMDTNQPNPAADLQGRPPWDPSEEIMEELKEKVAGYGVDGEAGLIYAINIAYSSGWWAHRAHTRREIEGTKDGIPQLTEDRFLDVAVTIGGFGIKHAYYAHDFTLAIAQKAYQLGADVELEACCAWLEENDMLKRANHDLRAARRPGPKSPPPDMAGGQKVEPEKPRGFFPFTPEEFATACSEPQPEALPEPDESRAGGWIVDRVPDAKDSSDEARGLVRIPQQPGTPQRPPGDPLLTCHWSAVQLGQPWAPIGYRVDPWDPTCLDRNGWIRSRLPTVEDAGHTGLVLLPMGNGGVNSTIAYTLIVPGQPWAPWGSNPGVFEK